MQEPETTTASLDEFLAQIEKLDKANDFSIIGVQKQYLGSGKTRIV